MAVLAARRETAHRRSPDEIVTDTQSSAMRQQ
jgi:hypothetical protein